MCKFAKDPMKNILKWKSSIKSIFGKQMAQIPENENFPMVFIMEISQKYIYAESCTVVKQLYFIQTHMEGKDQWQLALK